jgi:hypothetical protein
LWEKVVKKFFVLAAVAAAVLVSKPVSSEPGLGNKVYGAVVNADQFELELRYGELNGGPEDGEAVLIAEAAYGVKDWWYAAALIEFEREAGGDFAVEAVAFENLFELTGGKDDKWRTAAYVEIEFSSKSHGGEIELKGIVEYRDAPWNARANLILERKFGDGASDDIELGYALRLTREIVHEFGVGVEAFGEFGALDRLTSNAPHYIGPIVTTEIEFEHSEVEFQFGYLFGYGGAEADGQFRVQAEWEF